jgi:hypothetical protein
MQSERDTSEKDQALRLAIGSCHRSPVTIGEDLANCLESSGCSQLPPPDEEGGREGRSRLAKKKSVSRSKRHCLLFAVCPVPGSGSGSALSMGRASKALASRHHDLMIGVHML